MPNVNGGFYLKARCAKGSFIAKAPPHVREIWDWLIMNANFKDNGKLKRGQVLTTYSEILDDLSWYVGYRKVAYKKHNCETAMKMLAKEKMITTAKTTRGMIITICNYDKYQDIKNYESRTETDIESDNETATKPHDKGTNDNECTNDKEVKTFCSEPQKDEVQAPSKSEHSAIHDIVDEKPQDEKSKPRAKASLDLDGLPQDLRRDVILAFVESRKALRKPLTQRALLMCCKDAMRCQELHGIDPNDAMEKAIGKGWMTCDPEYFSSQKKPGKPSTGSDKHGGFSEKDYGTGGLI